MMFLAAATEPTMILFLTEQDINDMRSSGRTKFVDQRVTQGHRFDKVVISLHKNQQEVEDALRASGHAALLEDMPSMEPKPPEERCDGCQGIMSAALLFRKNCIACWQEKAEHYRRLWLDEVGKTE